MAQKQPTFLNQSFWIFWIGLLTGALLIALIFGYQMIKQQQLSNAILKSQDYGKIVMPNELKTSNEIVMPNE